MQYCMNFYLICSINDEFKNTKVIFAQALILFLLTMSEPAEVVPTTTQQAKLVSQEAVQQLPAQAKLIEPSVNKQEEGSPEPKDVLNLENNSIINQSQNEIPSLKQQPQNQNQNQSVPINPSEKALTDHKPSTQIINQSESNHKQTEPNLKAQVKSEEPATNTQQPSDQNIQTSTSKNIPTQTKIQPAKTLKQATQKQIDQTSKAVLNPKEQDQTSVKDISNSKLPQKVEPTQIQSPQKSPQKITSLKQMEKVSQKAKQLAKQPQQNNPVQSKVIDSHEPKPSKIPEQTKKKQSQPLQKSNKQIEPKPQSKNTAQKPELPQTEEALSFNQLLKMLLQKCKQKQQKANEKTSNSKTPRNNQTDLNLSLNSSQLSSQYPQNRIKIELKVLQKSQAQKHQQNQSSSAQHSSQQEISNPNSDKKTDFRIAFYLYNLKEPKNKETNQSQKENIKSVQILEKKLSEVTGSLNSALFSFKVTEKDDSAQEKNKLPLRTVKFSFQPSLISSSFGIKPERLQSLLLLLKNIEKKPQKSQMPQSEIHQASQFQVQAQNKQSNKQKGKKSDVRFTSSAQLCLLQPLKDLEGTKFLAFLSKGFKIRLQSKNQKKQGSVDHFEKVLREALFSLAPSLFCEYLAQISSGTANINFKSINDIRKLLKRLGIDEIFDQTPSTKEVLKDLIQTYLKSLFKIKSKTGKGTQTLEKEIQGKQTEISGLWKVFETIFLEANCQGLGIQIRLYQRFSIKLTIECSSRGINKIWEEAMK